MEIRASGGHRAITLKEIKTGILLLSEEGIGYTATLAYIDLARMRVSDNSRFDEAEQLTITALYALEKRYYPLSFRTSTSTWHGMA